MRRIRRGPRKRHCDVSDQILRAPDNLPHQVKPKRERSKTPGGFGKKTPYDFFLAEYRKDYKKDRDPSMPYEEKEMRKYAKDKYESLTEEEKDMYKAQAVEALAKKDEEGDAGDGILSTPRSKKPSLRMIDSMNSLPDIHRQAQTKRADWQPRKKTSAYDVYQYHYSLENKNTKGIIKSWKELTEEERKRYEAKAAQLLAPPASAMCFFLEDYRVECESVFPGTSSEDQLLSAMECWDDVTDGVKAGYAKTYQEAQEAYDAQMKGTPL
jgi:hypothetical protein